MQRYVFMYTYMLYMYLCIYLYIYICVSVYIHGEPWSKFLKMDSMGLYRIIIAGRSGSRQQSTPLQPGYSL